MMDQQAYRRLQEDNRARISMPAQLPPPKHSPAADHVLPQSREAAPPRPTVEASANKPTANSPPSEEDWRS